MTSTTTAQVVGGVSGQQLVLLPADQARLDAKLAEAEAYRAGQIDGGAASRGLSAAATPVPTKILSVTHLGQLENYYCGPATGAMIAVYKGMGDSAYNGATLNQRNMAGSAHMRTDINGKTSFTTGLFATGLNRWRGGSFFQQLANPSNAQFKDVFVTDIGAYSMPIGVSTIELEGDFHYNFHPSTQTIGHWIVGRGFENFAEDRVYFVDPAANSSALSSAWDNANNYFSAAPNSFNQRHVSYSDHGLAW